MVAVGTGAAGNEIVFVAPPPAAQRYRVRAVGWDNLRKTSTLRYARIRDEFCSLYGSNPAFYARSPGRVNIIGEHIDYSGYSVLPMALDRDIVIAVLTQPPKDPSTPTVYLASTNPKKYPNRTFIHVPASVGCIPIDHTTHEWSNYFKCGYKGVCEDLAIEDGLDMCILVDGEVPAGAGVSSSSAFVCSAALATLTAFNKTMTRRQLTASAIRAEKYAGVHIGGMDQSISMMGQAGAALLISFVPDLAATPVALPDDACFVVANTLVTADKHVTAPRCYNLRVVETRLAAVLMSRYLELEVECRTLRQVQDELLRTCAASTTMHPNWPSTLPTQFNGNENAVLEVMSALVDRCFASRGVWTRDNIAAELGVSIDKLEDAYISPMHIEAEVFKLRDRAKHVYDEARRVYAFRDVATQSSPNTMAALGALMNKSQSSCASLFQCSCQEVDELAALACANGALGSRLTGAGWGGCTVSLVPQNHVDTFVRQLKEKYYFTKFPTLIKQNEVDGLKDIIFASVPSPGSGVARDSDAFAKCKC